MTFAQFFLGENVNIILMCTLIPLLFLGGWLPILNIKLFYLIPSSFWFISKILLMLFTFVWVRVTFPRYRYDQLMRLGWKIFLPLSLGCLVFFGGILISFNILL
jgi:NADH-quinone oxidoreductase subunit H